MTFTHDTTEGGVLVIFADEQERAWLKNDIVGPVGKFGETERPYIQIELDALEPLICNSELEWVRPEEIGALTAAPILGIVERDDHGTLTKVIGVWGFEPYALRSFVDDLIESGKATFRSSF